MPPTAKPSTGSASVNGFGLSEADVIACRNAVLLMFRKQGKKGAPEHEAEEIANAAVARVAVIGNVDVQGLPALAKKIARNLWTDRLRGRDRERSGIAELRELGDSGMGSRATRRRGYTPKGFHELGGVLVGDVDIFDVDLTPAPITAADRAWLAELARFATDSAEMLGTRTELPRGWLEALRRAYEGTFRRPPHLAPLARDARTIILALRVYHRHRRPPALAALRAERNLPTWLSDREFLMLASRSQLGRGGGKPRDGRVSAAKRADDDDDGAPVRRSIEAVVIDFMNERHKPRPKLRPEHIRLAAER